jgi:hypothetical protein
LSSNLTWALFFAVFAINRFLMTINIVDRVLNQWQWAIIAFRLHILHRPDTDAYSPAGTIYQSWPSGKSLKCGTKRTESRQAKRLAV